MRNKLKKFVLAASIAPTIFVGSNAFACSSEPYLGSMCAFAGNFEPQGYAYADGRLLSIAQNSALFSLLGTTYGGDGRTTFALPDTRGRALIGSGRGPGLSNYPLGAKGGVESVILSEAQMPSHTHSAITLLSGDVDIDGVINLHAFSGNSSDKSPAGNVLAKSKGKPMYATDAPDVSMSPDSITFSLVASNNLNADTSVGNSGGGKDMRIECLM